MVSGRVIVIAAAAAAIVAAVGGAIWAVRDAHSGRPIARAAPSTTAAPTPSSPAIARTKPAPRPRGLHEYVAATAPNAFTYRGAGFTVQARVCGMEYIRPLEPPGEQHHTVCWVQHDFGYAPGSAGPGTTYVLGHAWAEDPAEVLNPISERATTQVLRQNRTQRLNGVIIHPITALNGDVITLRTDTGLLNYTVRSAYAVDKSQSGNISSLMNEHIRNRVVVITCAELGGVDYDYNVIVNAFLTESHATRT